MKYKTQKKISTRKKSVKPKVHRLFRIHLLHFLFGFVATHSSLYRTWVKFMCCRRVRCTNVVARLARRNSPDKNWHVQKSCQKKTRNKMGEKSTRNYKNIPFAYDCLIAIQHQQSTISIITKVKEWIARQPSHAKHYVLNVNFVWWTMMICCVTCPRVCEQCTSNNETHREWSGICIEEK